MKALDPLMQSHLEQSTTALAVCILVQRLDGVELAVTNFNRPLTPVGGSPSPLRTYIPLGFLRSDIDSSDNMDVGTTEHTGFMHEASITEEDVRAGRWDFAAYTVTRVVWSDLAIEPEILAVGTLGVVRTGRVKFVAEFLSRMQVVQQSIGALNSPQCLHELGDHRPKTRGDNGCTVDLALWTVTGTVEEMLTDYYTLLDAARTEPAGYFAGGVLEITSGVMVGMRREVRSYIPGEIVLFTDLPYDATGATYSVHRGCDKTLRTCIDVFDNILDRLASDYTQGNDVATQVGRRE
jgi:uncharacterized phage protein (TIGR02218 family)